MVDVVVSDPAAVYVFFVQERNCFRNLLQKLLKYDCFDFYRKMHDLLVLKTLRSLKYILKMLFRLPIV